MPDPTTNYGWNPPDVGGNVGAWGAVLNTLIDAIDTDLKAVEDEALKLTGGTLTGALHSLTSTAPAVALDPISGAKTVDCALGQYFYGTVSGNVVFTFSNPPASGKAFGFILELTNAGSFTRTWPSSVKWSGGIAPTLSTSGTDVLVFTTRDGGTTWRGVLSSLASA